MSPSIRRSKMISFRLSPEEYRSLQNACAAKGVRSISDLARAAMQNLIFAEPVVLSDEVRDLKDRVQMLSAELDRLADRVGALG
jgi:hypothetical protein